MEFAIIFFLLMLFVFIIVIICNSEGAPLFTGPIPKDRAQFLKEIFALTVDECKLLHFDGYSFHLREKRLYRDFESAYLIEAKDVRVFNPELPHYVTWQHKRVDGGPDRRYNSNRQIFISCRFRIRLKGAKECVLVGYISPYIDVSKSIEKINDLLNVATAVALEERFAEYTQAFSKAENFQDMLNRAQAKRVEVQSVVTAFERLKVSGIPGDPNMSDKHATAVSELNRLNLEIEYLQREMAEAAGQMVQIISSVHKEINRFRDLQKVKDYQSSLSSQRQLEQSRAKAQQQQAQQRISFRDYYKILQVDPSAESEVITGAYRRLAAKYHPDVYKGPDANQRMQIINEAYSVLNDPEKRKKYDQIRSRKVVK